MAKPIRSGGRQIKHRRGKNLDDAAINRIVQILDGFSGRATYSMLIDEIELQLKTRYTRQALFRHERIRLAFETKREIVSRKRSPQLTPIQQIESQTVSRLQSENARLKAENEALLQQFARWAYNAFTRGLDEAFLNQPLPTINRGQSNKI